MHYSHCVVVAVRCTRLESCRVDNRISTPPPVDREGEGKEQDLLLLGWVTFIRLGCMLLGRGATHVCSYVYLAVTIDRSGSDSRKGRGLVAS